MYTLRVNRQEGRLIKRNEQREKRKLESEARRKEKRKHFDTLSPEEQLERKQQSLEIQMKRRNEKEARRNLVKDAMKNGVQVILDWRWHDEGTCYTV